MRLLAIIPEYPPIYSGGISTYYKELFPALAQIGLDIKVLVPPCNAISQIEKPHDKTIDIEIISDDKINEMQSRLKSVSISPGVARLLAIAWAAYEQADRGESFDLVECTDWGLFFVPWLLASSRPPVIVRLHGSAGQIAFHDSGEQPPIDGVLSQLIETSLLSRAETLTTYSSSNQRFWSDQLSREIEYMPPPLNLNASTSFGQKKDDAGLVVGRVQLWKGAKTLCSALDIMGDQAPLINWIGRSVFSSKSKLTYDKELSMEYPHIWGSRVIQLPEMHPLDIRRRQSSAKFVLVPSDWDVFNFTAVEAMAQQAVVICSSGVGASDLIQHGKNGFIFPAKDSSMLGDVIRHVQGMSVQEINSVGLAARSTVESLLSPNRVAELTLDQYKRVLNQKPCKPPKLDLIAKQLSPVSLLDPGSSVLDLCLEALDLKILSRHVVSRITKKLGVSLRP